MKRILCFGDSNTYGYIPGIGSRYDKAIRWTGILSETLRPYGYEISEQGLNGRTTVFDDPKDPARNGGSVLGTILKETDPIDTVIIMLGTNDCKTRFHADAEMITAGAETLISQIRLYSPQIRILLLCPAYITEQAKTCPLIDHFDDSSIAKSHALRERYQELARRTGCEFLPVCDFVTTDPADGLHLSAGSHRKIAELLAEQIISSAE